MLHETRMTGALVELDFITNETDIQLLKTKQYRLAIAVAKGILNYFLIKYVPSQDFEVVVKPFIIKRYIVYK